MSRKSVVLCGVPNEHCCGGKLVTDQRLGNKCHHSHGEAFECMVSYLLSMGYEKIGPREFRPPDGGPVRVLSKRTRYGERLRAGKLGERYMPANKDVGNRGVIILT